MSDTLRVNNLFTTAIAYSTLTGSTIATSSITTPVIATTTGFTTIGQNTTYPNRFVEIGSDAANSAYFDFHSSDAALPDYSTRIQSLGGSTTGQGHMSLQASTIGILGTSGVGIGTTNPSNIFHVYGSSAPAIGMGNSTAANFFQIGAASFGGSYSSSAVAGDAVIRTTSGNLMLQTGTGAAAVYVNTSNNVIFNYNSSSPSTYKLCVEQGLSNNNGILISNSNYGSAQQFQLSMVNAGSGNFYSYAMIQTNTAGVAAAVPLCLQPNSASVGIGTNAPTGKCHIYGSANGSTSDSYSLNVSSVDSFNGDGGSIIYSSSINLKAGDLTWNPSVRVYGARIYIGGGYSNYGAQNQGYVAMYTGNTERMRIADNGYVGIGTAVPNVTLDAWGTNNGIGRNRLFGSIHDADKRDIFHVGRWDGTNANQFLGIKFNVDTAANAGFGVYDNQTWISFFTWGNSIFNSTECMRIRSDGQIMFTRYTSNGTLVTASSNGLLTVSSDRRIKEDIVYVDDTVAALDQINHLKPATFRFIGQRDIYLGFIAQDVEQYIPLAVDGKKHEYEWEMDEKGNPKVDANGDLIYRLNEQGEKIIRPRGLTDRAIIAVQTLAIQELSKTATSSATQIQELSKKNTALEEQIASILSRLNAAGIA